MLNRRQCLSTLSFALGAAALPQSSRAASALIRMGYFDKYAPFSSKDASGRMAGLLIDSVELAGRMCDLAFEHSGYPWARAQRMVEQEELDGLCTLPTAARSVYAEFCATPLFSLSYGVYHRANDHRVHGLTSIADLRAFRQGSYRGSGYAQENLEIERITFENDQESVLRRIDMGTLDVFIEGEMVTSLRARELGLFERLKFTPLPFLPPANYCFGLRRSYPDAHQLIERMEMATQAARKSKALQALLAKYR